MKRAFSGTAAFLLLLIASAVGAGEPRPVVVELFTSQGNGDCPAADALLVRLAERRDILALSLPVDYIDFLGWKDTLASPANTARQRAYQNVMGRSAIYLPQMVVDGEREAVGSREDRVGAAIDAAATRIRAEAGRGAFAVAIRAARQRDGKWRVAVGAGPGKPDAVVWLMALRRAATVAVKGGDNAGRTLSYRNVVTDIRQLGAWRGEVTEYEFSSGALKLSPHDELVVLVQRNGYGRMLGAARFGDAGGR